MSARCDLLGVIRELAARSTKNRTNTLEVMTRLGKINYDFRQEQSICIPCACSHELRPS
jgi:hypothetical protein